MDPIQKEIVEKCLKLQQEEQKKTKIEAKVKLLRKEIKDTMQRQNWTAVDLPGQLRVTLVEYVKKAVSQRGIDKLRELITPEDFEKVVIVKQTVNKDGITLLEKLLDEEKLLEVIDLNPRSHISFTDRDKS